MSWQVELTKSLDEEGIVAYDVLDSTGHSLRVDVGTRQAIEIYRRGSAIGFSILEWDETGGLISEEHHTSIGLGEPTPVTIPLLVDITTSIYSEYE
ncbi:hypothetical protein PP460_gp059 [Streptomyces phage Muntaha]|uniref:Uncharacterized protein n=1 Tax=Streptomyces phage Muntaha TaxID=2713269 RepID=A0A6G8R3J0_9CAUD|nr:hypothetical protein PP460_gp059 [Streptomyces phage Muntaha]QIN94743.1 hypothetical protein SEA_MUNTAHA_219 [Streptomyces phage Muntaha]